MPRGDYSFVTALHYMKVDRPLGGKWNIGNGLKISTSSSISKKLVTGLFRRQVGELEARQILDGRPFVYAISEYPFSDTSVEKQWSVLYTHLVCTQLFVTVLWLIKDNSVNFELGFMQYPYGKVASAQVSSNYLNSSFTTAAGTRDEVSFSTTELTAAIDTFGRLYGGELDGMLSPGDPLFPLGRIDRLSRALYFLQGARATPLLPEKIAYYCICFEALVSTSPSELAHQVAERVAVLIGNGSSDSLKIYDEIKKAYDTRSKVVHGSALTANTSRYINDSNNCDRHLRNLLRTLMSDPEIGKISEQDTDAINRFFLDRIFATSAIKGRV